MKHITHSSINGTWYERILLSFVFQLIAGTMLLLMVSVLPIWGIFFWEKIDTNGRNSIIGTITAFALTSFALRQFLRFPRTVSVGFVLPTTSIVFSLLVLFFFVYRVTYSNQLIGMGFIASLVACYGEYFVGKRYRIVRYAVVPFGEALKLGTAHGTEFLQLTKPKLPHERCDAVIADLTSPKLTAAWEKFLAQCTLTGIPVFHSRQIKESFTGRVRINRLSENEFGSLLPSTTYRVAKRVIDILAALLLLFTLIPVLLLIAIAIRLESNGPIFFLQTRTGYRGKAFTMIKFRSMYVDRGGKGFTQGQDDPRITRIGRYIRKFRVDEWPQIINILMGQMSFIGPRPESLELSRWYEKEVPFFAYRHIVRPGISGWAQVELGYAAEIDGMKKKLEYDFYYIKHFSFWLDTLIAFKTVKTIVTGFGAR